MKEANPEVSMTDMSKLLGAKWQEMSAEEKAPYEEQAAVAKEEHAKEKEAYDLANPQVVKPSPPKKAQSSFMIFSNEMRAEVKEANPAASFGDMGKIIGARWKA